MNADLRYIALLRGINVSGQKLIKMAELKQLFELLGFSDVVTYLQSGNVIFTASEEDFASFENKIANKIWQFYNFEVEVFVLTYNELLQIIENNPFAAEMASENLLYITLLKRNSETHFVDNGEFMPDTFKIKGSVIYLYCPNGYGKTKLNNNFFEKKIKTCATTRNFKTLLALSKIA